MSTLYIVFRKNGDDGWEHKGSAHAASAKQAVQSAALNLGDGEYTAVPARSWKPVTVTVATKAIVS